MRMLCNMEIYDWDDVQDELFGEPLTPEREEYERGCKEHSEFYNFLKSADVPDLWEKHQAYLNLAETYQHALFIDVDSDIISIDYLEYDWLF